MKQDPKTNGQETKQVLRRRVALGLVVAAGCAAFFWKCSRNSEGTAVDLMTAKVVRGDLLAAISASGTIEPEEVIDVGAQVAGQIRSFGKDASGKEIDYGSVVDEGMVLAEIDDSLYRADVAEAKARVLSARAAQVQSEAKLAQTERDWKRAQKLGPSAALSQTNYDAYQAAFEAAAANVDVTRAQVAQAEAVLVRAELNLGYCTIRSPVRGVIIDRRVNIGQTVVSSFNAPSLFLIAKDLQRMEVWAAVNEADVARIFPGQRVRFTVDALPGEEFEGVVSKVRLNAQMMQNVVTYTVEVQTGNAGGRLLPYLTANLKFETSNVQSVLLVPNAALRWVPPDELLGPEGIKRNGGGKDTDELSRDAAAVPGSSPEREKGRVWVRAGRYVSAIPVSVIGSDGVNSAVESTALSEGDEVVLRLVENQDAGSAPAGASPFAPAFRRGKR